MILLSLNFLISTLFLFMKHPLSMGLMLFMQTTITSLISGMLINNFWFSYILFLIFISGMLILFMYMINIASNEMLKISKFLIMLIIIIILILIINWMMMDPMIMNMMNLNYNNIKLYFLKYFSYPNNILIMFIMSYLFITLISSLKIINMKYGPIRKIYENSFMF
uniref:NADH-ubiquinone oxidoreductase chain 6 n=1 Tax=Pselaphinae sp. 8 EF-2015 TaxID=1756862 RepID=A0A0S2M8S2_9COLE|nr:NADH deshydrogenase subunit 6 [Pselaphinae sp. 8 EF-2015]